MRAISRPSVAHSSQPYARNPAGGNWRFAKTRRRDSSPQKGRDNASMFTYCSFAISWVLGPKVSLDIFVSTLTDDEAAQFDRAIVERAFKAIAVDQLGGYWNLQTPEGEMTSAMISVADRPRISHF
jgi:hypothetical protein